MLIVNKKDIDTQVISCLKKNSYSEIIVLGKGPTFSEYKKYKSNHKKFIIGINDTINVVECNMLVANDIETFDRLDNQMVSKLEFILVPCHPHKQESPDKNISYIDILKKKSLQLFQGKIIPFNLKTYPKNNIEYINLASVISSTNSAIDFIHTYMNFIDTITIFGAGIIGHHKYAMDFPKTGGVNTYNNQKIINIKNHIINSLHNKNLRLN